MSLSFSQSLQSSNPAKLSIISDISFHHVGPQRLPGGFSVYEVDTKQPGHDAEHRGDPHDGGDVD